MKRITRTTVAPGVERASDRWRSPRELVAALDAEFGFDLDLAADASNAVARHWLGRGGLRPDALAVRWRTFGRVGYLNGPYSSPLVALFIEHAARQSHEFTTVWLGPYAPSETWWGWTSRAAEIREIPHRVPYLTDDGETRAGAMFPSAVVIFRPQPGVIRADPRRVVWSWLSPDALEKRRARSEAKIARAWAARGVQG
jgi:phage N-6-adenine-methyltransferase